MFYERIKRLHEEKLKEKLEYGELTDDEYYELLDNDEQAYWNQVDWQIDQWKEERYER